MKKYIKPEIIVEVIELEDVIAISVSSSAADWDDNAMGIWDLFN